MASNAIIIKRDADCVLFTDRGNGHPAFIGSQFDCIRLANKYGFKLVNNTSEKAKTILQANMIRL